jgi:hypothetical protein
MRQKKRPLPFPVDPAPGERVAGLGLTPGLEVRGGGAANLGKPLMHCPPDGYGLQCFESGPEDHDGMSTTCMLAAGHPGKHEWKRDDAIRLRFGDERCICQRDECDEME